MKRCRATILLGNETFAKDVDVEVQVHTVSDAAGESRGWTVSTPPDFPLVIQSKPQAFRIEFDDGRKGEMMVDSVRPDEAGGSTYLFRGVGPLV